MIINVDRLLCQWQLKISGWPRFYRLAFRFFWLRYQSQYRQLRLLSWTHPYKLQMAGFFAILLLVMSITTWRGALVYRQQLDLLRLQRLALSAAPHSASRPALPAHIYIPWRIDAGITAGGWLDDHWVTDDRHLTYIRDSGRPTEDRPLVLYGHNTRSLLGNIRVLTGNENITLTTTDGHQYLYLIEKIKEVSPDDTAFLNSVQGDRLVMYTCSGFWDSKRFIVVARRMATS
jgi:hypothetical protein